VTDGWRRYRCRDFRDLSRLSWLKFGFALSIRRVMTLISLLDVVNKLPCGDAAEAWASLWGPWYAW